MEVSTFFNMGGYALYIWGSYTFALVILAVNVMQSKRRLRRARQQVSQ